MRGSVCCSMATEFSAWPTQLGFASQPTEDGFSYLLLKRQSTRDRRLWLNLSFLQGNLFNLKFGEDIACAKPNAWPINSGELSKVRRGMDLQFWRFWMVLMQRGQPPTQSMEFIVFGRLSYTWLFGMTPRAAGWRTRSCNLPQSRTGRASPSSASGAGEEHYKNWNRLTRIW